MSFHGHVNPGEAQVRAVSEGVDLNNRGSQLNALKTAKGYAAAVDCFQKSLLIKRKAYPEDSVHICIGLSGLADAYLGLGQTASDKAEAAKYLTMARAEAERMLAIGGRIGSGEQKRIAKEILADIARAEGKVPAAHNPDHDTLKKQVYASGSCISIEPPTRRCYSNTCPGTYKQEQLTMCGRCRRVYYCGAVCQRAHWPEHKQFCVAATQ